MTDRKATGTLGENMAAQHLQKLGFSIICRNYRQPFGEIDIIAEKNNIVYFVEVKTRRNSTYISPAENVDHRKRGQIARTAATWFAEQGAERDSALLVAEVRLDSGEILLIEDFLC